MFFFPPPRDDILRRPQLLLGARTLTNALRALDFLLLAPKNI